LSWLCQNLPGGIPIFPWFRFPAGDYRRRAGQRAAFKIRPPQGRADLVVPGAKSGAGAGRSPAPPTCKKWGPQSLKKNRFKSAKKPIRHFQGPESPDTTTAPGPKPASAAWAGGDRRFHGTQGGPASGGPQGAFRGIFFISSRGWARLKMRRGPVRLWDRRKKNFHAVKHGPQRNFPCWKVGLKRKADLPRGRAKKSGRGESLFDLQADDFVSRPAWHGSLSGPDAGARFCKIRPRMTGPGKFTFLAGGGDKQYRGGDRDQSCAHSETGGLGFGAANQGRATTGVGKLHGTGFSEEPALRAKVCWFKKTVLASCEKSKEGRGGKKKKVFDRGFAPPRALARTPAKGAGFERARRFPMGTSGARTQDRDCVGGSWVGPLPKKRAMGEHRVP